MMPDKETLERVMEGLQDGELEVFNQIIKEYESYRSTYSFISSENTRLQEDNKRLNMELEITRKVLSNDNLDKFISLEMERSKEFQSSTFHLLSSIFAGAASITVERKQSENQTK